jgi:hypothetical protein
MVGMKRSGAWWNPHIWYRRYHEVSNVDTTTPEEEGSDSDGWFLSIGPAIEFLNSGSWQGQFLPQVGLDSQGSGGLAGGAGLHLAYAFGFFQPQIFGGFESRAAGSYWTIGVGATLEFVWSQDEGPPGFWR